MKTDAQRKEELENEGWTSGGTEPCPGGEHEREIWEHPNGKDQEFICIHCDPRWLVIDKTNLVLPPFKNEFILFGKR